MVQLFPEVDHAENIERKTLKRVDCRENTSSSLLYIFLGLDCAVKQIADLASLFWNTGISFLLFGTLNVPVNILRAAL
jgi:hypothetical protein